MVTGNSVGIDYHQDSLRVTVFGVDGKVLEARTLPNSVGATKSFVERHGAVGSIAIEACTGSASFADELKAVSGWDTKLCHPGYVQRMRHNPDKSDKSDSYLLGDLTRVGYLPEVWLAPLWIRDLRSMVRYRQQAVMASKQVKLRIRAILRQFRLKLPADIRSPWSIRGQNWVTAMVRELPEHTGWIMQRHIEEMTRQEHEIKTCDKRLELLAASDAVIKELLSRKGIGLVTATVLRAEIGTFGRFRTSKQLARFCGVTPRNCSSGERQADAGLIKAGNPILKTALIEAAHGLMRYDQRWRRFAAQLKKRGKPYSVIAASVANRWVRKLFHEGLEIERQQPAKAAA